ncbi:uncharacterized protein LOC131595011 [Vicia villosa]|uniref:uncharacterized protein LOC131595011 n=1 Tax=Vicia villosa TaxID=3911 RepID=UPI00273B95C4|nr:uncharacterized protein LOC131595011 [Vicia villosa]
MVYLAIISVFGWAYSLPLTFSIQDFAYLYDPNNEIAGASFVKLNLLPSSPMQSNLFRLNCILFRYLFIQFSIMTFNHRLISFYAGGSQDMKSVGMQYLEVVRKLKEWGFQPKRSIHLAFSPNEEIGGHDDAEKFSLSGVFQDFYVGLPSPDDHYRAFYAERSPWWLVIKAIGIPGHGAKLYDNSAMENLLKSIETIQRYRASQFDLINTGLKALGQGSIFY